MSESNPENPENLENPESAPDVVAPAQEVIAPRKKNFYQRLTASVPLLITVIVHVVLIGGAAAIVVQQNSIGKKKTFEAANQTESEAVKQVEHRLQVARRGSASNSASSPVSANRIFSTAENAMQMPAMPDLPSMGAGGFGGFGGMGSGLGLGQGVGMSTSLGTGASLGGRGFMSMNFLGLSSQNVSKIVFVVDTSPAIMEPRKGGFLAFSIIREEIMRLVGGLPPGAQFNVILFSASPDSYNLYNRELTPATSENKKDFFEWMAPVNAKLNRYGAYSATRRTVWRPKPLPPESGVDPLFGPTIWAQATRAALELEPDVVFIITSSAGQVIRLISEEEKVMRMKQLEKDKEAYEREVKKEGTTPEAVRAARARAWAKVNSELNEANNKLVAAGKDPIVIAKIDSITRPDVQAALKKSGYSITLDGTGWTKKDGTPFRNEPTGITIFNPASWNDLTIHISRLQRYLCPKQRAALNLYLFVGPGDNPDREIDLLTGIAKKNGGNFQLLTTKRLEEIRAKELEAQKKKP